MKKHLVCALAALSVSPTFAALPHKTVELTVVNASNAEVCILGKNASQCLGNGSKSFTIETQNFYHRSGVIRVSINGKPAKIGMLKNTTTSADLYITRSKHIIASDNTFEPDSFKYSDNQDYLHFAAKPNYLFSAYPA